MKDNFMMKPKVDFCFKELMEDPMIRKGFIAAVLNIDPEEIRETKLLPTALRKEHGKDKLGILDFELFPEDVPYYSSFHFWEDNRRVMYSDKMEIHILELPKIRKQEYPETKLLEWMRFMNAEKEEEFKMLADKNEYLNQAYDRLSQISADEQKQLEYEARQKAIRDHNYLMEYNREEGKKEGIKEGTRALVRACRELGVTRDMTVKQLIEQFSLSEEEAEGCMKEFWT